MAQWKKAAARICCLHLGRNVCNTKQICIRSAPPSADMIQPRSHLDITEMISASVSLASPQFSSHGVHCFESVSSFRNLNTPDPDAFVSSRFSLLIPKPHMSSAVEFVVGLSPMYPRANSARLKESCLRSRHRTSTRRRAFIQRCTLMQEAG